MHNAKHARAAKSMSPKPRFSAAAPRKDVEMAAADTSVPARAGRLSSVASWNRRARSASSRTSASRGSGSDTLSSLALGQRITTASRSLPATRGRDPAPTRAGCPSDPSPVGDGAYPKTIFSHRAHSAFWIDPDQVGRALDRRACRDEALSVRWTVTNRPGRFRTSISALLMMMEARCWPPSGKRTGR